MNSDYPPKVRPTSKKHGIYRTSFPPPSCERETDPALTLPTPVRPRAYPVSDLVGNEVMRKLMRLRRQLTDKNRKEVIKWIK